MKLINVLMILALQSGSAVAAVTPGIRCLPYLVRRERKHLNVHCHLTRN